MGEHLGRHECRSAQSRRSLPGAPDAGLCPGPSRGGGQGHPLCGCDMPRLPILGGIWNHTGNWLLVGPPAQTDLVTPGAALHGIGATGTCQAAPAGLDSAELWGRAGQWGQGRAGSWAAAAGQRSCPQPGCTLGRLWPGGHGWLTPPPAGQSQALSCFVVSGRNLERLQRCPLGQRESP